MRLLGWFADHSPAARTLAERAIADQPATTPSATADDGHCAPQPQAVVVPLTVGPDVDYQRSGGDGGEAAGARPGPTPRFRFSELFAGIGGFRVALESLGGECVMASEINPWAKKLYSLNFEDSDGRNDSPAAAAAAAAATAATATSTGTAGAAAMDVARVVPTPLPAAAAATTAAAVMQGSVQLVDAAAVPAHEILTGGFPCQPFTSSGAMYVSTVMLAHSFLMLGWRLPPSSESPPAP